MKKLISVLVALSFFCALTSPYKACAALPSLESGSLITDDEIETTICEWVEELFGSARLNNKYKPRVFILYDRNANAGATTGGQLILFTGFIEACDSAEQMMGVLAHEVGHIVGGHLASFHVAQQRAIVPLIAATVLGGLVAAASGNPQALAAGLMGGQHIAVRGLLKYSRGHESAADQAALTLLDRLNWPTNGLLEFLKKLDDKMGHLLKDMNQYAMTHPLTKDRMEMIRKHALSTKNRRLPEGTEEKFQRIKAKIIGFLSHPHDVLARYPKSDQSFHARYARTIAHFRQGSRFFSKALSEIDALIAEKPEDPYLYELKGQILFENGRIKQALEPLQKAVELRPNSAIIKAFLSHVIIESHQPALLSKARKHLLYATQKEPRNALAWRLLATAAGRDTSLSEVHRMAIANWAMAEIAFLEENTKRARKLAEKALKAPKLSRSIRNRINDLLAVLSDPKLRSKRS